MLLSSPNPSLIVLFSGVDALEGVYQHLHQATYNAAGWVGMTILGGPNPRLPDGELSLKM